MACASSFCFATLPTFMTYSVTCLLLQLRIHVRHLIVRSPMTPSLVNPKLTHTILVLPARYEMIRPLGSRDIHILPFENTIICIRDSRSYQILKFFRLMFLTFQSIIFNFDLDPLISCTRGFVMWQKNNTCPRFDRGTYRL